MSKYNLEYILRILVVFLLILASTRGILVLNFEFNANLTYMATAIIMIVLSLYGYSIRGSFNIQDVIILRKILKFNVILGIINIIFDLFFGMPFPFDLIYLFIAPFIIFVFLRVSEQYIYTAITIITLLISYSVIDDFIHSLNGVDGMKIVYERGLKLRPDTFQALSRTGDYFRASGYTANYHDSANILGMSVIFFFSRFIVKKHVVDLFIYLFSISALLLTQSAANIIITTSILIFIIIFFIYKYTIHTRIFILVLCSYILWHEYGEYFEIFYQRINHAAAWQNMVVSSVITQDSIISTLVHIVAGHAAAFNSASIHTEAGLYGLILQLGIVHAIIFFSLMLFPLWRFISCRMASLEVIPYLAAVVFGFASLLHYGSITRITSVFLFFALLSMCIIVMERSIQKRKY